ncbi:MAG: SpoIIE family protein phosphatase [Bacteroidales bacterium]|nr:SpoIIE family protein phosphatase [Bacteroidales bacterium]
MSKQKKKKGALYSVAIIITAAVILEAISGIQYYFSRKAIENDVRELAQVRLTNANLLLANAMNDVEVAVKNVTGFVSDNVNHPEKMFRITGGVIKINHNIIECGILFNKDYYPVESGSYHPATYRDDKDSLVFLDHGVDPFNYYERQWYREVIDSGVPNWTDPYLSHTNQKLICTYSRTVTDKEGNVVGVIYADITLEWLRSILAEGASNYENSFSVILNEKGRAVIDTRDGDIPEGFYDLRSRMVSRESGEQIIEYSDTLSHAFFAPIGTHGWSMAIVCPVSEMFKEFHKISLILLILMVFGLFVLGFIVIMAAQNDKRFRKVEGESQRLEDELMVAHGIQMGMLSKVFPPFPDRVEIDIYASLTPAKEVGGDLYDNFLHGDTLWFCVADVSGKGVPAALVMALARSQFRTEARHGVSPSAVMSALNLSMSEVNESNLFVTMFIGALDVTTGSLRYCNAGHNPPVIVCDGEKSFLPVKPNLPFGLIGDFPYKTAETSLKAGSTIFLYTDGLTESESVSKELFGEEKMFSILDSAKTPEENVRNMSEALDAHAAGAEQSDDLTMLAIRFNSYEFKSISFPNKTEELAAIPGFVESLGLSEELTQKLCLALDEAATNVVLYAYDEPGAGEVKIDALLSEEKVSFKISDSGKPFNPLMAAEPNFDLPGAERPVGGLGIFLVKKLMDVVYYRRDRGVNILRITKNLK